MGGVDPGIGWPAAAVLIVLVIVPNVLLWIKAVQAKEAAQKSREAVDRVETTLTKPNGGGSVHDQLRQMNKKLERGDERFDRLDERLDKTDRRVAAIEHAIERRRPRRLFRRY